MASTKLAGRVVHLHRVRLGLSPEQYGDALGISGQTIRRIECGGTKPHRLTQRKLAGSLGVQVDELWPPSLDNRKLAAA